MGGKGRRIPTADSSTVTGRVCPIPYAVIYCHCHLFPQIEKALRQSGRPNRKVSCSFLVEAISQIYILLPVPATRTCYMTFGSRSSLKPMNTSESSQLVSWHRDPVMTKFATLMPLL